MLLHGLQFYIQAVKRAHRNNPRSVGLFIHSTKVIWKPWKRVLCMLGTNFALFWGYGLVEGLLYPRHPEIYHWDVLSF